MPYIKPEARESFDKHIDNLVCVLESHSQDNLAGNLNYIISSILARTTAYKLNYATANALVGALECAKLEFYRRVTAPYEDLKILENGDVYE